MSQEQKAAGAMETNVQAMMTMMADMMKHMAAADQRREQECKEDKERLEKERNDDKARLDQILTQMAQQVKPPTGDPGTHPPQPTAN